MKVEGRARLGAEVVLEGTTSVERQRAPSDRGGAGASPSFPRSTIPDIIAGQGTVGVEILEDWPDVETIIVPIGGGGLISGIAAWVKQARPECA
jgi:threonine dehydratase